MAAGYPPRFTWGAEISSANDRFEIDEGGGALTVDIPDGIYYWRGDGTAQDWCRALKTALEAAGALTYTVTISTAGVLTIGATGAWSLIWGTGVHDLVPALLGHLDADHASAGGANEIVGDFQVGCGWWPEQITIDDEVDHPVSDAAVTVIEDGRYRSAVYGSRTERAIRIDVLPARKIYAAEEVRAQESFQRLYAWMQSGGAIEYTPNAAVPAVYTAYTNASQEWAQQWPPTIPPGVIRRYDVAFRLARWVG